MEKNNFKNLIDIVELSTDNIIDIKIVINKKSQSFLSKYLK